MDVQSYFDQGFKLCNVINSHLDIVMKSNLQGSSNSAAAAAPAVDDSGTARTSNYIDWTTISQMMHSSVNQPYINHDTDSSSIEKCRKLFSSLSEGKGKSDKVNSKVSAVSLAHASKYYISVPDEYFGPTALSAAAARAPQRSGMAAAMPMNRPLTVNSSAMSRKAANFVEELEESKKSSHGKSRGKCKSNDVTYGVTQVALSNSKAHDSAPILRVLSSSSAKGGSKSSSKSAVPIGGKTKSGTPGKVKVEGVNAASTAFLESFAVGSTPDFRAAAAAAAAASASASTSRACSPPAAGPSAVATGVGAEDSSSKTKRGRSKKDGTDNNSAGSAVASIEGSRDSSPLASPTGPNGCPAATKRVYKSRAKGSGGSTGSNGSSAGLHGSKGQQEPMSVAMKTVSVQTANNTTVLVTVPVLSFQSAAGYNNTTLAPSPLASSSEGTAVGSSSTTADVARAASPTTMPVAQSAATKVAAASTEAAAAAAAADSTLPDIPTVSRFISPLDGSVIITTSSGSKKRKVESSPPKLTFCTVQGCYIPAPPTPPKE